MSLNGYDDLDVPLAMVDWLRPPPCDHLREQHEGDRRQAEADYDDHMTHQERE